MKIKTQIPAFLFSLIWLAFSMALTGIFTYGVHQEVQQKGGSPWLYAVLLFPLCFVMIGLWMLVVSFREKTDSAGEGRFQAKTEIPKSGVVGAFLFALPFFLSGLAVMIFFSIVPVVKTIQAMNWENVPAEVIYSEIKTNEDSDGDTYKPDVHFRYSYDGYTYESDTYDFQSFSTSSYESARKKVSSVPVGSRPMAYVNPRNPQEAVLSVRLSWIYLLTFVFGGIFAAVGGFIIFAVTTGMWKSGWSKKTPAPVQTVSTGPQILKSRSGGPTTRFVGILVFTLIWNGVVYFLFRQDAPFFFKLVFGVVGLLLIWAVIHGFLALFNPRLEMEVDTRAVSLGESFRLKWRILGKSLNIKRFTIALIGQEEATYRRGTSTSTDRQIFYEEKVLDQSEGIREEAGSLSISIPPLTMYSWKSTNNRIVWFVKVSGEIEKWPDIGEEYEITALPIKQSS